MSTSDNCKDGVSKSNDGVCEVNNMLHKISTADEEDIIVSVCANCGKEGDDINNICNKCEQVKYCNASCKKKHRHKHKKDCEEHVRLAAELAAKLHDEKLFQQPPPEEDCPICFIQLPTLNTGSTYMSCCGKLICSGCIHAPVYDDQGNKVAKETCPFCRATKPKSNDEIVEREKKRVELNDPIAIYNKGVYYRDGYGYPQDHGKALELWHQAAELGHAGAYLGIGNAYFKGRGVEVDEKKATYYTELAAMGGDATARYNLGLDDVYAGNMERAIKHFNIAVRGGYADSLNSVKKIYSKGYATKEDYTKALQLYQEYLVEIKSPQRDKAAAADEYCRYY